MEGRVPGCRRAGLEAEGVFAGEEVEGEGACPGELGGGVGLHAWPG